jgi:hypothetical protein
MPKAQNEATNQSVRGVLALHGPHGGVGRYPDSITSILPTYNIQCRYHLLNLTNQLTSQRLHCHQPFLCLRSLNAAGLANTWLPLKSIAVPGPPRQGLKALQGHITSVQPATTANTTSSEIAVTHAALLLGMIALAYIPKIQDATAVSRVGKTGKAKRRIHLERVFGSALQGLVITSLTGRMERLMRTRRCCLISTIFIPTC